MCTLRDIVSNRVKFIDESDLLTLEDVRGLSIKIKRDKTKLVTVHIGLIRFFFNRRFKDILRAKLRKDLGWNQSLKFKFRI